LFECRKRENIKHCLPYPYQRFVKTIPEKGSNIETNYLALVPSQPFQLCPQCLFQFQVIQFGEEKVLGAIMKLQTIYYDNIYY